MLFFGLLLLIRKHYLLKEVTYKQLDNLIIKRNNTSKFNLQIDGELYVMNNDILKISILKKSLAVIIP